MSEQQGPFDRRKMLLLGAGAVALIAVFAAQHFLTKKPGQQTAPAQTSGADRASKSGGSRTSAGTAPSADRGERPRETKAVLLGTDFRAMVTSRGATLSRLALMHPRFQRHGHPINLVSTTQERYWPLRLRVSGDVSLPFDQLVDYEVLDRSRTHVRLRYRDDNLEIVRRYEIGRGPYQLWVTSRVTNLRDRDTRIDVAVDGFGYTRRAEEGGGFLAGSRAWHGEAACLASDGIERHDRSKLEDGARSYGAPVRFAGFGTAYFLSAIAPDDRTDRTRECVLRAEPKFAVAGADPDGDLYQYELRYRRERLRPGQSMSTRVLGYFGPKDLGLLAAAGHGLPETVNLGFFSFIARGLLFVLNALHGVVGNWGIAIILLTVLVKAVLFPLTARSFKSMEKMRALKPELDKMNELYKDDREKKGAATMELYRKAGVNPFGGCLPSLAQLPVWWALYTTLQISVELYRAPFLLWSDLSAPDPYYVMPLVLGGLMFLQQRLTPTTMDPTQAKIMMYAMPVMFTAFMLFLPVGLCLYMTVNSALSILQQQAVMRNANRVKAGSTAVAPPPTDGDVASGSSSSPSRDPKPRRKTRGGR